MSQPSGKRGRHTSTIQNELLLASLTKFFTRTLTPEEERAVDAAGDAAVEKHLKDNLRQILKIVKGTSPLSLRLIDWFVTNYSKKYNVVINKEKKGEFINVYIHYRSQLRAYSKHLFDPFRRQDKIKFFYYKQHFFNTTIGQLNFFRWAIENKILVYITEHFDDIVADMNSADVAPAARKTPSPVRRSSASPRRRSASPPPPPPQPAARRPAAKASKPSNVMVAKGERVLRFD
jgi:hypothetical protein